uniref:Uncharacterized protein n=1 Tax=Pristionchus pacificus TaxID=54126 RepID=A0A2A6C499_PRIPA|eukprot:PDM73062.1 hypothetical protein PRIPAC_39496 [Pristionchus pacificus]
MNYEYEMPWNRPRIGPIPLGERDATTSSTSNELIVGSAPTKQNGGPGSSTTPTLSSSSFDMPRLGGSCSSTGSSGVISFAATPHSPSIFERTRQDRNSPDSATDIQIIGNRYFSTTLSQTKIQTR